MTEETKPFLPFRDCVTGVEYLHELLCFNMENQDHTKIGLDVLQTMVKFEYSFSYWIMLPRWCLPFQRFPWQSQSCKRISISLLKYPLCLLFSLCVTPSVTSVFALAFISLSFTFLLLLFSSKFSLYFSESLSSIFFFF